MTTKIAVFDVETTGVDVKKDRIVQLGVTIFDFEGRVQLTQGQKLFNPGVPIPSETTAVHGIRDIDVSNSMSFGDYLSAVDDGFKKVDYIVGYNCIRFDVPMLENEFARYGQPGWKIPRPVIDVSVFVNWYHRGIRGRKLTDMCTKYEVIVKDAHTAAADTRMTGELMFKMIEDGLIPEDLDRAVKESIKFAGIQNNEFEKWSYWLYNDRKTREVCMGAGKHCGVSVARVPRSYLGFMLGKMTMTEETRRYIQHVYDGHGEQQDLISRGGATKQGIDWGGWDD